MQRRPSSQDVSWFLDLKAHNQLELDPPYQRRSVWNLKDRRYFLDTIFSDYPSPQIFLHKIKADSTMYAVVDGKQRLQTLFMFVDGDITLDPALGNERLRGKRWDELDKDMKRVLWDYVLPVEFLIFDEDDTQIVNLAFDRLNRNMRKLDPQELRHARWSGWLIKLVEEESEKHEWQTLGVVTKARAKRMKDAQFISELIIVLIEQKQIGFDQETIDQYYATYDDPDDTDATANTDDIVSELEEVKGYLIEMQDTNGCVKKYGNTLASFYSLWAAVALHRDELGEAETFAGHFATFIETGKTIMGDPAQLAEALESDDPLLKYSVEFQQGAKGAATDLKPRQRRLEALLAYVRSL